MTHGINYLIWHYCLKPLLTTLVTLTLLCGLVVALYLSGIFNISSLPRYAQGLYWSAKAKIEDAKVLLPEMSIYGDIVGLTDDGMLKLFVPEGKHYVVKTIRIANVRLRDVTSAKETVGKFARCAAKAEVYQGQAIVWCNGHMINLELIESGAAVPDPAPPTPAYNAIFARFLLS